MAAESTAEMSTRLVMPVTSEWLRMEAVLARLPEMLKRLRELEKQMAILKENK